METTPATRIFDVHDNEAGGELLIIGRGPEYSALNEKNKRNHECIALSESTEVQTRAIRPALFKALVELVMTER